MSSWRTRAATLAWVVLACGCSDSTGSGGAGAGGADAGGGAGATGGGGSAEIACDAGVFPEFGESCETEADCAIVLHQTDCCGTLVALGVRADEVHTFDIAEAVCEGQYPGCGCAAQPTTAEDGQIAPSDDAIAVRCDAGACATYVP